MAAASDPMEQAKHGGDHSSRPAVLQARRNEQKALSLWLKGATYQQIAVTGFGITSAGGAWRSVRRALARIPKQEADQARQAQLARLQELRLVLWNQMGSDPIRAAEALIRLEAREARLLGLDSPTKVAVNDEGGLTLTMMRTLLARKAEAEAILQQQQIETTAEEVGESATDENDDQSRARALTLEALRRAGNGSGPADDRGG